MSRLRRYVIAVVDIARIAVAFGGLLFSCSNQESDRQAVLQKSAMIQRAIFQAPLDGFLSLDEGLWQQLLETPSYYSDGASGLLVDVRYWEETADVFVEKILKAGYTVDYVNPVNERVFIWVKNAEQLAGLAKIRGVSAVSVSRTPPKKDVAIKVFDDLQK